MLIPIPFSHFIHKQGQDKSILSEDNIGRNRKCTHAVTHNITEQHFADIQHTIPFVVRQVVHVYCRICGSRDQNVMLRD